MTSRPQLTDASILIKSHNKYRVAYHNRKIDAKKNASALYNSVVVLSAASRNPKRLNLVTRLENTMIASAVSLIECSVLFIALMRSLVAVTTPKVSSALHYAFVLLPLSLLLASQVGVATATEDGVDD